jgi:hypothetical protein
MAIGDAYATAPEYRTVITKHDGEDDASIDADLLLISRVIERKSGRVSFNRDAADVTRVFTTKPSRSAPPANWAETENPYRWGNYSRELVIPDLSAAPTSIKIDEDRDGDFADETALAVTDYLLQPEDAPDGPEPEPYTSIQIPTWSTKGGFPANTRVEIIGKWGWPAVPGAIKRACIELTAVLRLESPRATRTVDAVGTVLGMSKLANDILAELLDAYDARLPLVGRRR